MDTAQTVIPLHGTPDDPPRYLRRLGEDGVILREACFDTGRGGEPVEIVHLTDIHFNKLSIADMREYNPSVISTADARGLRAYGMSVVLLRPCLEFAVGCDQLVITGDTLDYMTHGALDLLDEYIWKPFPDALVTLGNHDASRVMGLPGTVDDPTTLEERYDVLRRYWKHDILYTARTLGDKVTVIQLDNSRDRFWDSQIAPLAADIADARASGRIILLFFHSPLCSRNPAESALSAFGSSAHDAADLYEGGVGYHPDTATAAVYDLITCNADVVKGVFVGHRHSSMYSEIMATAFDGTPTVIPLYVVHGIYSDKYVMKITVT